MLGWMDDEALHRTLTTGRGTYWSRSREEYWVKGETSGTRPARARGPAGLRRRHPAGDRRPARPGLPHRRPHLLRRGSAAVTARGRRLYAPVVLGTLAAGGLAFLALGRTWERARVAADGLPSDVVTVSGSDAYPLASALALVVVTAAIAVLATGGRVRRGVGALVVVASVGAIVAMVDGRSALDSALSDAVTASPAFTGGRICRAHDHVVGPGRHRWPSWSPRCSGRSWWPSRRGGPPWAAATTHRPRLRRRSAPETEADIWKALDEGRDPTQ